MSFQIVDDLSKANALTHGGTFHADEVLACVVLSKCMDELKSSARLSVMPSVTPAHSFAMIYSLVL